MPLLIPDQRHIQGKERMAMKDGDVSALGKEGKVRMASKVREGQRERKARKVRERQQEKEGKDSDKRTARKGRTSL